MSRNCGSTCCYFCDGRVSLGPSSGGRWSWHVSYGGPKGHAATAAEALAAAREAAQPEARKWTRMAS